MKGSITKLLAFLSPSTWCKGEHHRDAYGAKTLNSGEAKSFCLLGAMGHILQPKEQTALKRFLEGFLYSNAPTFLPELFAPLPRGADGKLTGSPHRTDYSNLARFNDEKTFLELQVFLNLARENAAA